MYPKFVSIVKSESEVRGSLQKVDVSFSAILFVAFFKAGCFNFGWCVYTKVNAYE